MAGTEATTRSPAYTAVLQPDGVRARETPANAFRAAVRAFEAGPRLDMGLLAERLGISKTTLYRWTGSREQLIGDILSYLSERGYDQALEATAEMEGVERVMAVARHFVETVVTFEPLNRFIENETPLAFRILTIRGGPVEETVSRRVGALLEEERLRGSLTLRAPAATLAYAITKATEGFIYSDPLANIDTDIDAAMSITRLLLE